MKKQSRDEARMGEGTPTPEGRSAGAPGIGGYGASPRPYFPVQDDSPAQGPFTVIRSDVRSDGRGRVTIGQDVIGDTQYRALRNQLGQIILDPVITVPAREFWLLENPKAFASVVRGVRQAQRGELGEFPSFAEFATAEESAEEPAPAPPRRKRAAPGGRKSQGE